MSTFTYDAALRLRERWDDATRTYTAWDAAGVQTVQRPYTDDEATTLDALTAASAAPDATMRDRLGKALAVNDAFLALAAPTNAQTVTQVQRLTRECSALIRLALADLDTAAGT